MAYKQRTLRGTIVWGLKYDTVWFSWSILDMMDCI